MYLIKKSQVSDIAKELQKEYQVYGPVVDKETKQTMFVKADDIAEIDLAAPIPAVPPKHTVFPHYERIMAYNYDPQSKKWTSIRTSTTSRRRCSGFVPAT